MAGDHVEVDGKTLSPCDVEKLQKCLAENHGDRKKCEAEVLAFKEACGKAAEAPAAAAASEH